MVATSRAGRPVAGGATARGRGQPSASGTDRVPGDDAAVGADGTGTVVHGDVRTSDAGSDGRDRAGSRRRRSVVPPLGRSTRSERWSWPPTGTDGGPASRPRGCDDRDVRARSDTVDLLPEWSGPSTGAPTTGGSAATGGPGEAIGVDPAGRRRTEPTGARPVTAPARRAADPRGELAERLDTVLDIAGRLAASHDRAELFRMIVDETKRALRADATTIRILRDDHLEVAAWAGLTDDVAGRLPVLGRDEGSIGEVLRSGHVLAVAGRPGRSPARRRALRRRLRHRRSPRRPADPPRPGHRRAVGGDARAARLDERRRRVHRRRSRRTPRSRSTNAELFEQTVRGPPSSRSSRPRRPG